MPKVYAIDGITPVVHPSASSIRARSVGRRDRRARGLHRPLACLRATLPHRGRGGANIQDTCMLHGFRARTPWSALKRPRPRRGAAWLRGAAARLSHELRGERQRRGGEDAVIAALAFRQGRGQDPARSLAVGIPASVRGRFRLRSCARKRKHAPLPAARSTQREHDARG